jgi:UDP-N-acetylmuramoyl-tripeptide--D-alanyl-D-alanine ligase
VKGDRVDGHDYVEAAMENDAVAAVVSQHWLAPAGFDECKLLRVPEECDDCVLDAMQKLARAVRKHWGKRVIGVTGSAGKTTTKECVAQVLSAEFKVLKTEGNFNNHYGLPLTLLRLEPEHDVAVVEMGMNHAGEIRALAKIAEPDWGVVSNVAAVHLEHFADGIDGIARVKKELIDALPAGGVAVLNADDARVRRFGEGGSSHVLLYGTAGDADVHGVDVEEAGLEGSRFAVEARGERCDVELKLMGRHNVLNALAAIAVGLESGIALETCCAQMEELRPTEKRGALVEWGGAKIVNDTYNSNPTALKAMISALMGTEAERRIVVAGEMLELGPEAAALHADCGEAAAAAGVDVVVGVRGLAQAMVDAALAAGTEAVFVASPEEAGAWMKENLREGDVVLLKASRGVRLERALEALPH